MFSEIVHDMEIALENFREFISPKIQEAQIVQAWEIKVKRAQRVIAKMEIQEIR